MLLVTWLVYHLMRGGLVCQPVDVREAGPKAYPHISRNDEKRRNSASSRNAHSVVYHSLLSPRHKLANASIVHPTAWRVKFAAAWGHFP